MKKGILVAILALLAGVTLVGCDQKSGEQANTEPENSVSTTTEGENTQEKKEEEKTEEAKDGEESKDEEKTEDSEEQHGEPMDLGAPRVEGEAIDGTIYNGKYRLTNGSDRIVVEWSEEMFKNVTEYVFDGDKLSSINFERTYSSEEQAKADYDAATKNEEAVKKLKDLRIEGAVIKYSLDSSEWKEIKDYSKQQIFDEQKKAFDELSKVDDIRSDD